MTAQAILAEIDARMARGGEPLYMLAENLHITEDGRAVSEEDVAGRFVLGAAGRQIPLEIAQRLGLAEAPLVEPPVTKAVRPAENKRLYPTANKHR